MVDCVKDVFIRDAVPARRVVNLHTDYRTTKNALGGRFRPTVLTPARTGFVAERAPGRCVRNREKRAPSSPEAT